MYLVPQVSLVTLWHSWQSLAVSKHAQTHVQICAVEVLARAMIQTCVYLKCRRPVHWNRLNLTLGSPTGKKMGSNSRTRQLLKWVHLDQSPLPCWILDTKCGAPVVSSLIKPAISCQIGTGSEVLPSFSNIFDRIYIYNTYVIICISVYIYIHT